MVSVTVREVVWTGAWIGGYVSKEFVCLKVGGCTCGTRPLGIGMPVIPAMKVVQPRRKKSQWNPAGFSSGYCRP